MFLGILNWDVVRFPAEHRKFNSQLTGNKSTNVNATEHCRGGDLITLTRHSYFHQIRHTFGIKLDVRASKPKHSIGIYAIFYEELVAGR